MTNHFSRFFVAAIAAAFCLAPFADTFAKEKKEAKETPSNPANEHVKAGLALVDQQQYAPAIEEFTKAIEADPNSLAAYENRAAM